MPASPKKTFAEFPGPDDSVKAVRSVFATLVATCHLPCVCHGFAMQFAMRLPWVCHGFAMRLPCVCHVFAMCLPCVCYVCDMCVPAFAMHSRCICPMVFAMRFHVFAMRFLCVRHVFAMSLPCVCHVFATVFAMV